MSNNALCERCARREILHVAFAIAAASLATGYQAAGAWAEKTLAPVIADQHIEFVARGPHAACWLWRFRRARDDVAFMATDLVMSADGDQIDGTLLIVEGGDLRYFRASRSTPRIGPSERVLCVDLHRARVRSDQAVSIRAAIHYQPRHGFWSLKYDLPVVDLLPAP